jgi:hypothetical protein
MFPFPVYKREDWEKFTTPVLTECICPSSWHIYHYGCTCGWWQIEKAAKATEDSSPIEDSEADGIPF